MQAPNYFELFDIPISFTPDPAVIKQRYLALTRKHHPDFFTNDTAETQLEALEQSALINKAYKTLRNEEATLAYVLELKGALTANEKYTLNNAFLMEVMEWNEALTNALMEDDEEAKQNAVTAIEQLQQNNYETVAHLLTKADLDDISQEALLQVKEYYYRKKYLDRILATIK
ncbi:MAG: Fe-S protein assembly co-chaperone HscB [Chitinophagaceae bacterium]|jgi:molecular chaperone HscB